MVNLSLWVWWGVCKRGGTSIVWWKEVGPCLLAMNFSLMGRQWLDEKVLVAEY